MVEIVANPSKKIVTPICVVGVIDIQQIMLSGYFEGYILSRFRSYDVVRSGYKFIDCDLINKV
jgi:hypothetical protein